MLSKRRFTRLQEVLWITQILQRISRKLNGLSAFIYEVRKNLTTNKDYKALSYQIGITKN